jgi:succinyl-CoA synthetase alpha subunit
MPEHRIVGPDGKPIDPALAARLAKNPNLMVGRPGSRPGPRPRMEVDLAVTDESIKKIQEKIEGLAAEGMKVKEMFDQLMSSADEVIKKMEALRDAVHCE